MTARNLTLELERRRAEHGSFVSDDPAALAEYRARWVAYRRAQGYAGYARILTPPDANTKMRRSVAPTYGLTLAPADMSGAYNLCSWSTSSCRAACVLVTAGKGTLASVRRARIVRTRFLAEDPDAFLSLVAAELRDAVARHGRIVARLNVASDIRWERVAPEILATRGATFYDYTKAPADQRDDAPDGYRLTYSVSERPRSTPNAIAALTELANAAVVFATRKGAPLPETWNGFRVIDGDASDDRSIDPRGVVVGLRAKGSARGGDGSVGGFVKPDAAT